MLGQQQYQQLEDLKNKPSPQDGKDNDKKRAAAGPSGQGNQQMTGIVTPQLKRVKTENNNNTNIPPGMPMGPPMSIPMNPATFKPPQAPLPNMPGLQVPPTSRPTALPGQQQSTPAKSNASTPAPGQANAADRIDYDQLTDVMGYAGVDLREEEQHFMKDGETPGGVLPDGVDRSKTQEFMNSELLKERVLELAKPFGLEKLDGDFVSLLALATQERLRGLAEQMVIASKHRTMSQHVSAPPPVDENGQPLYKIVIQQDTKKQLLAIERAEREEEQKRKEAIAERERRAQMGKEGGGGEEGRSKSKKKDKDSSQQRGGLGDGLSKGSGGGIGGETALMKAIGGVRKSWMLTGNARDQQSSSSAATGVAGGNSQQQQPSTPLQDGNAPGTPGGSERGGDDSPRGRGRPRGRKEGKRGRGRGRDVGLFLPPSTIGRRFGDAATRKVTVRDALFALERDCQAGGQGSGQKTLLKTYNQWLK
ncbi:transcription initiation factor TFIID component TAF4 family-domain-containing protein [Circinella umbellata]|nr:transcription initiation factor TFIID component TAF4 family-domain-containing protein [Circinella umbellata]